jgi:general secretion pathway protein H
MVVVILGILAGVVVIGFTGADRQRELTREAKRLALVMEMARDESIIRGLEFGLDVLDSGYQFLVFDVDREKWTALTESPYAEHALAQGIDLDLQIEDQTFDSARLLASVDKERPEILILSSGELTPFVIELIPRWEGAHWLVASDGLAAVEATPRS